MTFVPENLQPISRNPATGNVLWSYVSSDDASSVIAAVGHFTATGTGISVDDSILAKGTDQTVLLAVTEVAVDGAVTTAGTTLDPLGITLDPNNPIEPDIDDKAAPTTLFEALSNIHERMNLKGQISENIGTGVGLFFGNDVTEPKEKTFQFRSIEAGAGIAVSLDTAGETLIIAQDGAGGGGGGTTTNPNAVARNVAAVKHAFSGSISDFGDNGVDDWSLNLNFSEPEQAHSRANVSSNPAPFAGSRSLQTEIRSGDPQWSVDVPTGSKKRRNEYSWRPERFAAGSSGTNIPEGWYGGAFYLPSDPMDDIRGCAIFQLHNSPDPGVMWNIYLFGGNLISGIDFPGGNFQQLLSTPVAPFLDQWNRMVVNFKPSTGSNGFIRLFLNETQVYSFNGPNKSGGVLGPYAKHGLYFWGYDKQEPTLRARAIHDNLTIADQNGNFDLVDPRTFPRTD